MISILSESLQNHIRIKIKVPGIKINDSGIKSESASRQVGNDPELHRMNIQQSEINIEARSESLETEINVLRV